MSADVANTVARTVEQVRALSIESSLRYWEAVVNGSEANLEAAVRTRGEWMYFWADERTTVFLGGLPL